MRNDNLNFRLVRIFKNDNQIFFLFILLLIVFLLIFQTIFQTLVLSPELVYYRYFRSLYLYHNYHNIICRRFRNFSHVLCTLKSMMHSDAKVQDQDFTN